MSPSGTPAPTGSSTRPYLIRALHDWCTDNGFTPYVAVFVDASVQVPLEYAKNNEIVLNIGFEATTGLKLGNDFIEFKARFGGMSRDIVVPVDHVIAIYARENGQGMAFPAPSDVPAGITAPGETTPDVSSPTEPVSPAKGPRLALADAAPPKPAKPSTRNDDEPVPPEPPAGGGAARPALKRVK